MDYSEVHIRGSIKRAIVVYKVASAGGSLKSYKLNFKYNRSSVKCSAAVFLKARGSKN